MIFRNSADEVFAVHDKCPTRPARCPRASSRGKTVTCPLHSWKIQLEDGQVVAPDVGCVKHFPTKVENGEVFLAL